jgi:hypothetical protein
MARPKALANRMVVDRWFYTKPAKGAKTGTPEPFAYFALLSCGIFTGHEEICS